MKKVYEIVTYEQAENVTDQMVQDQSREFQKLLCSFEGVLSAKLAKSSDGKWLDCVVWSSMEHALAASKVIESNETAAKFMTLVKAESVSMVHYSLVEDYK